MIKSKPVIDKSIAIIRKMNKKVKIKIMSARVGMKNQVQDQLVLKMVLKGDEIV